jgi:predicted transposase/invertase (TIGR01784 family)
MFQLADGYSVKKTREQAKQEAMKEALDEKIEIALKLIKRGLNIKDIAEDTGLSITEIEQEIEKSKQNK